MPRQKVYLVTACKLWRVFWRTGLIWLTALAAALVIKACEEAAFGAVLHGRLIGNMSAVLVLAGLVDGVITLFQAGWFRFNESGYGIHIPWRGRRGGGRWEDVNFIGLVPGSVAGTRYSVMVLIVNSKGKARAIEYRWGLVEKLLTLHPDLRVAALAENKKVAAICRRLDEAELGWLPLSWVQHMDGSGELVLRAQTSRRETPAFLNQQTASSGEEQPHA